MKGRNLSLSLSKSGVIGCVFVRKSEMTLLMLVLGGTIKGGRFLDFARRLVTVSV